MVTLLLVLQVKKTMPISIVNRAKTIAVSLTESDENNIIILYQNQNLRLGSELMPGYKIISFNSFIKNLKASAQIKSLPAVTLPEITDEDSETEKLYKVLDVEWKSPRKHLDLFISSDNNQWHLVDGLSLLNPSGYPYRVYDLMQFFTDNVAIELGDNSKIGCQIKEVGYGLLAKGDKLTIHGSYVEEIFLEYAERPINITVTGFTTSEPSIPNIPQGTLLNDSSEINNSFLIGD